MNVRTKEENTIETIKLLNPVMFLNDEHISEDNQDIINDLLNYRKCLCMLPRRYGNDGKTPEERLLEQIFHEPREEAYATTTCFYRYVKNRRSGDQNGVWVKSSINPLDSSYIAINPEDLE